MKSLGRFKKGEEMEKVIEITNLTKHYGKHRGVSEASRSIGSFLLRGAGRYFWFFGTERSRKVNDNPVHAGAHKV